MTVDVKYTARADATGGRNGRASTDDGSLDVRLVVPKELGGPGGDGVNPEKLFGAGYAACFLGALRFVAGQENTTIPADATVSAEIGIGPRSDGGFGLRADLGIRVPGMERGRLEDLIRKAEFVCPYAHATRGNIESHFRAVD